MQSLDDWVAHGLIDVDQAVTDYDVFYGLHRLYLWISTVQWLATLPILWIMANFRSTEADARAS